MAESNSLWEEAIGDPEAEDIGPALTAEEIRQWELRYGVALPEVCKRAYQQQDGGMVRGNERGVALHRLNDVEPLDEEGFEYLPEDHFLYDTLRQGQCFRLGWDDVGASLLLHYPEGGGGPQVYAYYSDGGAIELLANNAAELYGGEA